MIKGHLGNRSSQWILSEDYLVKRFDGFVGIKEIKGHGAKVNPLTKRKLTETRTETQQQCDETYSHSQGR